MDAGRWYFLGSQRVELKRDHFSYWHCAPVDLVKSVFTKVHFLATRGHLFGHNLAICGQIVVKLVPPCGQKMIFSKNRLREVNRRAMPIGKMV